MSTSEKMTIDEQLKYLRRMRPRYRKAGRKEKGRMLDDMVAVTGCSRKHVIELLAGDLERHPRRGRRGRAYGPQVDDALRVIHEALDYICPERLTPNLVWMAQQLGRFGELTVTEDLLSQLGRISTSTVARYLRRMGQDERRLPRRPPRREKAILAGIPMMRLPWDIEQPGYFEVDLVHHSGPSATGHYLHTIQWIDIATGWSERRAVLGRSYLVMQDAFRSILSRLPFPVLCIHPDNDSAFFNYHMQQFWGQIVPGVALTRSRPYHKNDNPHVEQANRTGVRYYLGHSRLDTVAHALAANQLYADLGVYNNFFQPTMHLKQKVFVRQEGQPSRVIRRHDTPRTPFHRLCQTDAISPEHKAQLQALRDATNPRQLRQQIYDTVEEILSLPNATPGRTESVFETLSHSVDFENAVGDPLDFGFRRTEVLDELD
jgi:hypothetical protein